MTILKQLQHSKTPLTRTIIGLAVTGLLSGAAIGFDSIVGQQAMAKTSKQIRTVNGDKHKIIVDHGAKE